MVPAIRSEFLKFFTTRLWWGMAIGIFAAGALFSGLFAFLMTSKGGAIQGMPVSTPTQLASSVYTSGISVGYLLLLTIGVLTIGSEYRHKTITSTFLALPKRLVPLLAKALSLIVIGALYGVISLFGSVAVGATVLHFRGADPFPSATIWRTLALGLLVLGLWALIGLGVGILIPNQVAALLIGVGVAWIVEPLIGVGLTFWAWGRDHIAPYLPTAATNAALDAIKNGKEVRLEWWAGALVLVAYAVLLAGLGIWRASRQDVT